jgi:hypothetical protein
MHIRLVWRMAVQPALPLTSCCRLERFQMPLFLCFLLDDHQADHAQAHIP